MADREGLPLDQYVRELVRDREPLTPRRSAPNANDKLAVLVPGGDRGTLEAVIDRRRSDPHRLPQRFRRVRLTSPDAVRSIEEVTHNLFYIDTFVRILLADR